MLLTLGCPGAKCASDALWLKDERAELFVMTRWNQALTELVIFQWNGHQMGWAACFWLTGVLDVAGACWERKTLPRSKYVFGFISINWWEMPGRIQRPGSCCPGGWCPSPGAGSHLPGFVSRLLLRGICSNGVNTFCALCAPVRHSGKRKEKAFVYLFIYLIQTVKYLSKECNIQLGKYLAFHWGRGCFVD